MPALKSPVARTPLHSWHASRGAHFTDRGGWQVVARYAEPDREVREARSGLGLADVSATAKVSLQGPGVADLARVLVPGGAADKPRGVGPTDLGGPALACRLADDHLLVLALRPEATDLPARLEGLCRDRPVVRNDATSAHAGFCLVGPHGEALLRHLTQLDVRPASLPPGSCAETALAGVEALLVRPPGLPVPATRVYVAWDMAEYVWGRLGEAGGEGRVTPLGLEALTSLGM